MTRIFLSLLVAALCLNSQAVNKAFASPTGGSMEPTQEERLNNPQALSGPCSHVSIIEWRSTRGKAGSEINKKNIAILKKTCKLVVNNFESFIKQKRFYKFKGDVSKFNVEICLMPLNSKSRNLNDLKGRFLKRAVQVPVWGYYQYSSNNIYIRNDVMINKRVNKTFVKVFAHELFHAMSSQFEIYDQHSLDPKLASKLEEKMARDFTEFIKLGR